MKRFSVLDALVELKQNKSVIDLEESNKQLSKFDDPKLLLQKSGEHVYHATSIKYLDSILEKGLTDFWFGIDYDECIEMVLFNHKDMKIEDIIVVEIPTSELKPEKCDFTVDNGDGWSDNWAGTGFYHGTVTKNEISNIWKETE
jgi:hypothetical protein